jgi:hypothetical protein
VLEELRIVNVRLIRGEGGSAFAISNGAVLPGGILVARMAAGDTTEVHLLKPPEGNRS